MKERLPEYWPRAARAFAWYLHGYFARHFNAVRVSDASAIRDPNGPLIVYANHPSWWDPIHFLLLGANLIPGRRVYGPMEAQALRKYGFFRKIGAFGVEVGTARGAATFLRTGRAVLSRPDASLWLTAQGRFRDPRDRPVRLLAGLGSLASRLPRGRVVPLAVEYPFWDERLPEALSRFGRPFDLAREPRRDASSWTERFERRLAETQDALAAEASSRDPTRFRTLVDGTRGVGGVYDRWRQLKAALRGESFEAAHRPEGWR